MKAHLDIAHSGSLGDDDRTRMSFDENSIAHLMSVLTDLYSDQEMAVIREYSTNAIDSHVEADNPDPIELTSPSAMNPVFVVRDYGVGMTADDLRNNYSKYGRSTKRDTDEQTGMLGLGCKSALAYTSQFTVVATKDGHTTTALVTREADGAGTIQIVEEFDDPDARNGVEIRVPVKNTVSFSRKIKHFVTFVDPGVIMLDGEKVVTIWEEHHPLRPRMVDPDVVLVEEETFSSSMIVMGNVAYPISLTKYPQTKYALPGFVAIARVPIGTVNFTPNREELTYTRRTEDTIHEIDQFVKNASFRAAQEAVSNASSAVEAMQIASGWKGAIPTWRLLYKGAPVPVTFRVGKSGRTLRHYYGKSWTSSSIRNANVSGENFTTWEWLSEQEPSYSTGSYFVGVVTGFPNFPPNEYQYDQMMRAFGLPHSHNPHPNLQYARLLVVSSISDPSWLPCPVLTWNFIKENYPSTRPKIKRVARTTEPQIVIETIDGSTASTMQIKDLKKRDNSKVVGYITDTRNNRDLTNVVIKASRELGISHFLPDDGEIVFVRNDSRAIASFDTAFDGVIEPLNKVWIPVIQKADERTRFVRNFQGHRSYRAATSEWIAILVDDGHQDYYGREVRRLMSRVLKDVTDLQYSIYLAGTVDHGTIFTPYTQARPKWLMTNRSSKDWARISNIASKFMRRYPMLEHFFNFVSNDWEVREAIDIFSDNPPGGSVYRQVRRQEAVTQAVARHGATVNEYIAAVDAYRRR